MTEVMSSPFVMHGARDAVSRGLVHIEQQVQALESVVAGNPALAFDLAKTLVESVCRTVLGERSIAFSATDDLPKLFKVASTHLPFLPATATDAAKTRQSLAQTLSGCIPPFRASVSCATSAGSPRMAREGRAQ